MIVNVLMPAIGAGTSHGKIIQWLKKKGDRISVGDLLAEIETDKAVIELEALDDGVLTDILTEGGGQEVAVGQVIATLSQQELPAEESTAARIAVPALPEAPIVLAAATQPGAGSAGHVSSEPVKASSNVVTALRHFASPSARHLARQMDIDVQLLQGSGPGGRVVRIDVENAASKTAPQKSTALPVPPPALAPEQANRVERVVHSNMRKTIARRLTESKQQIPHFYLSIDCRMDELLAMRTRLNVKGAGSTPAVKFSVNDILVYAVARAVRKVPQINARWADDAIEYSDAIDLCVAVSTDAGLMTPVVRDADRKGLGAIAVEISALADKARAGRLAPQDYQGGGLTISNLGMYGITQFSAIINPPQAAILAIGAVEKRPVIQDDTLAVGHVMTMTLSADHRVIDGALGARFLSELRALLEDPLTLIV